MASPVLSDDDVGSLRPATSANAEWLRAAADRLPLVLAPPISRKNKPRSQAAIPAGHAGATDEGHARAALSALGAGRFKDAIEQYKALLKRERRPEWIAALAEA